MMKKRIFYRKTLLLFALLAAFMTMAQETVSKQIKESYPFPQNGSVSLTNKYGDVTIYGWDKSEVEITIRIDSQGKDEEIAKELLDRIQPNIKASKNKITITSVINKKEEGVFRKFLNKISATVGSKANSQIDYTIYVPQNIEVEVVNKYGDIRVSDWDGYLIANVEHGDVRLPHEIKESNISIKYGTLKAFNLREATINANDATLNINNASQLKLMSNGSIITLDQMGTLQLDSNKDEIEIASIKQLDGESKYGTIIVKQLSEKINIDLDLTELRIAGFSTPTPAVRINQENSEVYVNISNISFKFNANLEQGVLRLPKTMQNIQSDLLDKKNMIRSISATYGNQTGRIFSVIGVKGVIILKEL